MGVSHLHQRLSQVGSLLNKLAMLFKEGAEEQAEVLDKILLIVLPIGIGQPNISVQRQHLCRRKAQIQPLCGQTNLISGFAEV